MKMDIPNVLAERYASPSMKNLWSASGKVIMEREFWIAVMKAQRELGIKIAPSDIEASEKAKVLVDLDSIRKRERRNSVNRVEWQACVRWLAAFHAENLGMDPGG